MIKKQHDLDTERQVQQLFDNIDDLPANTNKSLRIKQVEQPKTPGRDGISSHPAE